MATYIKPEAIKDASLPIGKVAAMSENERLAFLVSLGLGNLTEVPDDGKVYGRKHGEWVEDEDGAVYELIEDITLEEAVQKIVRTKEPDGTPYNFKRMMVYLKKPSTEIGASYRQVFLLQNAEAYPFCVVTGNLFESHQTFTICKPENGHWTAKMDACNRNGVSKSSLGMTDDIDATGEYNRILGYQVECSESVLFEAGTNIKIYGIR